MAEKEVVKRLHEINDSIKAMLDEIEDMVGDGSELVQSGKLDVLEAVDILMTMLRIATSCKTFANSVEDAVESFC